MPFTGFQTKRRVSDLGPNVSIRDQREEGLSDSNGKLDEASIKEIFKFICKEEKKRDQIK